MRIVAFSRHLFNARSVDNNTQQNLGGADALTQSESDGGAIREIHAPAIFMRTR